MNISFDPNSIDWPLLREQKQELIETLNYLDDHFMNQKEVAISVETIEGLVHFIDFIQDSAADVLGEEVIFGEA